jgi:hypothetical protein
MLRAGNCTHDADLRRDYGVISSLRRGKLYVSVLCGGNRSVRPQDTASHAAATAVGILTKIYQNTSERLNLGSDRQRGERRQYLEQTVPWGRA